MPAATGHCWRIARQSRSVARERGTRPSGRKGTAFVTGDGVEQARVSSPTPPSPMPRGCGATLATREPRRRCVPTTNPSDVLVDLI